MEIKKKLFYTLWTLFIRRENWVQYNKICMCHPPTRQGLIPFCQTFIYFVNRLLMSWLKVLLHRLLSLLRIFVLVSPCLLTLLVLCKQQLCKEWKLLSVSQILDYITPFTVIGAFCIPTNTPHEVKGGESTLHFIRDMCPASRLPVRAFCHHGIILLLKFHVALFSPTGWMKLIPVQRASIMPTHHLNSLLKE